MKMMKPTTPPAVKEGKGRSTKGSLRKERGGAKSDASPATVVDIIVRQQQRVQARTWKNPAT